MSTYAHQPVLLEETVKFLNLSRGSFFIDGTIGEGGHAERVAQAVSPAGKIIGIDRDSSALEKAKVRLSEYGVALELFHGRFEDIFQDLLRSGTEADGILLDLGISVNQLENPDRGFSFRERGPLDMRMDRSSHETAATLLHRVSQSELAKLLWKYGEERYSKRISRAIVSGIKKGEIQSTLDLSETIYKTVPGGRHGRVHPATRTFQAIRIAVNNELERLEEGILNGIELLRNGGKIAVISFHSLEDRIVKETFRDAAGRCRCPRDFPECVCGAESSGTIQTLKPVRPQESEVDRNPKSRSARLRVFKKIIKEL